MEVSSSHEVALAPRWTVRTAVPCVSLAAVAILSIGLLFRLSPPLGVIATLSALFLMAIPGVFIGMALFGWNIRRQPESVIFGVPLGLMLSGYVALMLGYLGHWSVSAIVPALLALAALAGLFAFRQRRSPLLPTLRSWKASDYSVLGLMGLTVLGFVAIPFSRIGELSPFGHAYTWLFGFDFIARSAYAASITIGLPIDHIHMAGVPLQMYLVGYVLPAFSYSLCRQAVHMQAILLVAEVMLDLVFVSCLLAFWRLFAKSANALAATAVIALIGYSYYGWTVIAHCFAPLLPPSLASWLEGQLTFGRVSHLFQRLFMVEPQAIVALAVFLFVLTVVFSADRRFGFALSCVLGLAIGIEFGVDSWLGLTLAAWFAGVQLMRLWRHWDNHELWSQSLLVASIAGALWATFFLVRMVGFSSGSLVSIGPYWWGLKFGILQDVIEYGPMLPLGLLGLIALRRESRFRALSLGLIVAIAVVQDLFVGIAQLPHFRMGNRLLPVVLLAGTAWLLEHGRLTPARKWLFRTAVVLAVPTLITDIVGASNVLDRHDTSYVSSVDLKACEWIRTHLPAAAIVQSRPDYVGDSLVPPSAQAGLELSLIPMFALRRSALGEEYIARAMCAGCENMVKLREADLDTMFRSPSATEVLSMVAKYKIDYLYVGPFEQSRYPDFLGVLSRSPRFNQVYDEDSVHIFRIVAAHPPETVRINLENPCLRIRYGNICGHTPRRVCAEIVFFLSHTRRLIPG